MVLLLFCVPMAFAKRWQRSGMLIGKPTCAVAKTSQ
jgi:hypothetical protein